VWQAIQGEERVKMSPGGSSTLQEGWPARTLLLSSFVIVLIGQPPVILEHRGLTFRFNMAYKSRDHFELFLEELLRSLEENGITFALKAVQQKAI